MSGEDAIVLFRMFAIACGGVVLVLAIGSRVREQRRAERRELQQQAWLAMMDRLRKRRERVTYHRSTAEWNHNHGPKDAA